MFYHLSIFFCLDSRLILEPPGLPRHGGQYEWVCRRHQFLGRAAGPPNRSSIVAWSLRSDLWKGLAHVWSQELAWGVMICDACDGFFCSEVPPFFGLSWHSKLRIPWLMLCHDLSDSIFYGWIDANPYRSLFVLLIWGIFFKIPWFNNSSSSIIDWVYTFNTILFCVRYQSGGWLVVKKSWSHQKIPHDLGPWRRLKQHKQLPRRKSRQWPTTCMLLHYHPGFHHH